MKNQDRKDRRYYLICEDSKGNELFFASYLYPSLKYARSMAEILITSSKVRDLYRIRIGTAFLDEVH